MSSRGGGKEPAGDQDADQGVLGSVANYRLAYLLKRAQSMLIDMYGPALADYGIDGRELAVLSALDRNGPISQQQVSREFGIDRTTMVALVDALEGKGLVRRRPHASDRRKNIVQLTGQGEEVFRRAAPAIDEAERRFLEPLGASDIDGLHNALRILVASPRPSGGAG